MKSWIIWIPSPYLIGMTVGLFLAGRHFDNSWKSALMIGFIVAVGAAIAEKVELLKIKDYIGRNKNGN